MGYTVDMIIRTPEGKLVNISKNFPQGFDGFHAAKALFDSLAPCVHSHIRALILHDGAGSISNVTAKDAEG